MIHSDQPPAVNTVTVDGVLRWGNYTLRCPTCHAARGWTLEVRQEAFVAGERAWRVCPNGHRSTHPLVYPEMVHAVMTWAHSAIDARSLAEALHDWQPHRMVYETTRDGRHCVEWRSWHEPAPPDYWSTRWPELVRAASPT